MKAAYNGILAGKTDLNIVCIGNAASKKINTRYRGKNTPANVLSFPGDDGPAEIYLNTPLAKKTAKTLNIPVKHRILFLCIHAMLHLLGHAHGKKMEDLEDQYATEYV